VKIGVHFGGIVLFEVCDDEKYKEMDDNDDRGKKQRAPYLVYIIK
jgi:hypothetical protein